MPSELEHIDLYLSGGMSDEERAVFEARMAVDPALAEAVAFQLVALAAARETAQADAKARFRAILQEESPSASQGNGDSRSTVTLWIRPLMAAAALVVLAGLVWVFFLRETPPQVLAQAYIKKELTRVGVSMGIPQGALAEAKNLFNDGDLVGASKLLDSLALSDPDDPEVKKLSGIVSLRQGDHDKALERFRSLASMPGLYANPGEFLEALTLMDRGGENDLANAKALLEKVVRDRSGGAETAARWLKEF